MQEEIEKSFREHVIVLDTSATTSHRTPIIETLYNGLEGLKSTDHAGIEYTINQLEELVKLNSEADLVVISEVHSEIQEGLKQLDAHISYLKDIRDGKQKYTNERTQKHRNRKMRQRWERDDTRTLELLMRYSDKLYEFTRLIERSDPRTDCTNEQAERIIAYFEMADHLSGLLKRLSRTKEEIKNPLNIGKELETDKHIISTAFSLAHESPVIILTRDNGIKDVSTIMGQLILSQTIREICGIREPSQYPIKTLTPTSNSPQIVYLPEN